MILIEIGKKQIQIPGAWDELTDEQIQRIGWALLQPWGPKTQYMLLRLLTPEVEPSVWVNLSDAELVELLRFTEFLQKPIALKSMPLFRMGLRKYHLPDARNLRTADFAFSEQLVKRFLQTGDEKALNQLVAAICRPVKWWIFFFPFLKEFNLKWNGDPREKFHSAIMQGRAEKIGRKIPMHKRLTVVWWVVQIRWEIMRSNGALFNGSGKAGGDWFEAAMDIAERNIFGNFETTMQTNFNLVLKYLNHQKNKQ